MLQKSFFLHCRWGGERLCRFPSLFLSVWAAGRGRAACCLLVKNKSMRYTFSSLQAGNPGALLCCAWNIWVRSWILPTAPKPLFHWEYWQQLDGCTRQFSGRNWCKGLAFPGRKQHIPVRAFPQVPTKRWPQSLSLSGTTGPYPSDFGLHNLKAGAMQSNCPLGRPNMFSASKK